MRNFILMCTLSILNGNIKRKTMVDRVTPLDFVFLIGGSTTAKVSSFGHIPANLLLLQWLLFLLNTCPGGLLDFASNTYHHSVHSLPRLHPLPYPNEPAFDSFVDSHLFRSYPFRFMAFDDDIYIPYLEAAARNPVAIPLMTSSESIAERAKHHDMVITHFVTTSSAPSEMTKAIIEILSSGTIVHKSAAIDVDPVKAALQLTPPSLHPNLRFIDAIPITGALPLIPSTIVLNRIRARYLFTQFNDEEAYRDYEEAASDLAKQLLVERVAVNAIITRKLEPSFDTLPSREAMTILGTDDSTTSEKLRAYEDLCKEISGTHSFRGQPLLFAVPAIHRRAVYLGIRDLAVGAPSPSEFRRAWRIVSAPGRLVTFAPQELNRPERYLEALLSVKAHENEFYANISTTFGIQRAAPILKTNYVDPSVLGRFAQIRTCKRHKRMKLLERLSRELASLIPDGYMQALKDNQPGSITWLSDLPMELMDFDGTQLCYVIPTQRIPLSPGYHFMRHFSATQQYIHLPDRPSVAVISALEPKDPLNVYARGMIESLKDPDVTLELHTFSVNNVESLRDNLNRIRPSIAIFDGHGSYDMSSDEGFLHLQGNAVSGKTLATLDYVPPIFIVNACSPAPWGSIEGSTAYVLLMIGAVAVVAPFIDVNAREAAIFATRLVQELTVEGLKGIGASNLSEAIMRTRLSLRAGMWSEAVLRQGFHKGLGAEFFGQYRERIASLGHLYTHHDQEEIFDKVFAEMGYRSRYDALRKAKIVEEFGLYWSVLGSADLIFVR
jgi:hypothetical protein